MCRGKAPHQMLFGEISGHMGPRIRQCVLKLVMHVDLTALQTNDWEFVLGKQIRISGESPSRVIYNNGGGSNLFVKCLIFVLFWDAVEALRLYPCSRIVEYDINIKMVLCIQSWKNTGGLSLVRWTGCGICACLCGSTKPMCTETQTPTLPAFSHIDCFQLLLSMFI